MMTKQQHIEYWVVSAEKDWKAVNTIFDGKEFVYALFFAHLVLEKLIKAHWIKDNAENIPPKRHNLLYLLKETTMYLDSTDEAFLVLLNQFQLEGRYPDYKFRLIELYKEANTKELLDRVNAIRLCLLERL